MSDNQRFDDAIDQVRRKALDVTDDSQFRKFMKRMMPVLSDSFDSFIDDPNYVTMTDLADCVVSYCGVKGGKIRPQSVADMLGLIYYIDEMKAVWLS